MAYTDRLERITYEAGETVAVPVGVPGFPGSVEPNIGTQYLFVKMHATRKDTVDLATAATDQIAGITTTKAQHLYTAVAVTKAGRVPVQAGEALAIGDYVIPGTGGRAFVGTSVTGVGIVVEPASAAGVLATIELKLGR